jgi:selenocysteine lyase/cysteine desulfurase
VAFLLRFLILILILILLDGRLNPIKIKSGSGSERDCALSDRTRMNAADARTLFPGTREHVFLDAACVSLMPTPGQEALAKLGTEFIRCPARDASAHHIALDRTAEVPRREAARLIGAAPEDIALVESTTQGLEAIAAAVPLAPRDRVLVGATEFLGLAIPWIPRSKLGRFHIDVVPHRDGRLHVDDFRKAVDVHTRMILLSSVQWNNGFRADLAAFSQFAQERRLVLVVDAIQQLGAIGLDVRQTPVDFLVCGGHKWLNAPAGRGFLYVSPEARKRFTPTNWGYLNVNEPPVGWASYFATTDIPAVRDYDFTADARRFEIGGTANYPGNVVLGASLALINAIGIDVIQRHILDLTDNLIDRMRAAGALLVSPYEQESRSGIVTFTLGQGPARDTAVLQQLLDRNILISQRYTAGVGGLRVSVHFFNNGDDIKALAEAISEARRG